MYPNAFSQFQRVSSKVLCLLFLAIPLVVKSAPESVQFDYDGDGKGDIIYRGSDDLKWRIDLMDGSSVKSSFDMPNMSSCCGWIFNGSGDFNGDGTHDVIIRNVTSGQWYIYNINSDSIISRGYVPIESAIYIGVQAVADFNNDGKSDVLLRNENTGEWNMTLLDNRVIVEEYLPPMSKVLTWNIVDAKDFDGNGSADILIRNTQSSAWYIYLYENTEIIARGYISGLSDDLRNEVKAIADFDGDGKNDILFRHLDTNIWTISHMNGRTPLNTVTVPFTTSSNWEFNSVNDFNGDGISDVTIRNRSTEELFMYLWDGTASKSETFVFTSLAGNFEAQSLIPNTTSDANTTTGEIQGSEQEIQIYYNENLSTEIIQGKCITCHIAGGVAGNTDLLFVDENTTNYQLLNQQSLASIAKNKGSSYILDKVQGGLAHGGGPQLSTNSEEYNVLATYLTLTTGESTSAEDEDFWAGAVLSDNKKTLRRAAILLAGRLPTEEEYNAVADNSNSSLKETVKGLMNGDNFHRFLVEGANDRLLTEKFALTGNGANFVNPNFTFMPGLYNYFLDPNVNENRHMHWMRFVDAFAYAPLELIAYVIENDKPYTEILTADYTMVNPASNIMYGSNITFEDPENYKEYRPGQIKWHDFNETIFEDGPGTAIVQEGPIQGWPHAGVLSDPAFMQRYPTTFTNRNRARSRWTYFHYLGFDIEKSAARSLSQNDLADTNNPTMNNQACIACHEIMDPVAGTFQFFDDDAQYKTNGNNSLSGVYLNESPLYQWGDAWYRDMRAPGFNGLVAPDSVNTLPWLAQQIIKDPRFATAAIEFWWPSLIGKEVAEAPEVSSDYNYQDKLRLYEQQTTFIESTGESFQSHWNMKEVFAQIIISPWFRLNSIDSEINLGATYLSDAGTEKLLTPEQLVRKTESLTGYVWGETFEDFPYPNKRHTYLTKQLRLTYGGIDSEGATKRATEANSIMALIAKTHAMEASCSIVVDEFNKNDNERLLFKGFSRSTVAGSIVDGEFEENPEGLIKVKTHLVELYQKLLGEWLGTDDEEILRAYQLYISVVEAHQRRANESLIGEDRNCSLDFSEGWDYWESRLADPHGTLNAWRVTIAFLMSDYKYIHE